MQLLKQHIEALVFCSENSISLEEIQASLKLAMGWEVEETDLITALEEIKQKYQSEDFAFELCEIAEGYQFLTKKQFYGTLTALLQHKATKKLSVAQMETLAIIAYKQPISKPEIEHIRGVNCDYAMQKLLEKDMIVMQGKSDGPGRPMMYATSQTFMDYFGIKNSSDLPQLKDLRAPQNEIGTAAESLDEIPSSFETLALDENGSGSVTEEVLQQEQVITDESPVQDVLTDENPEASDLPDRKKIFMENENLQEASEENTNEITSSHDEEELPS
jgi:segregation and condensation protein B